MAVPPHVKTRLVDRPRSGTPMPPAEGFRAERPGDVLASGQPRGALLGSPGPDLGYALRLAERFHDQVELAPHEALEDAVAVATGVAMRRCALFGRAPVLTDVEMGFTVFGYLGDAPEDLVEWRREQVRGVSHDYMAQRKVIDAVREGTIRLTHERVRAQLDDWRELFELDAGTE